MRKLEEAMASGRRVDRATFSCARVARDNDLFIVAFS